MCGGTKSTQPPALGESILFQRSGPLCPVSCRANTSPLKMEKIFAWSGQLSPGLCFYIHFSIWSCLHNLVWENSPALTDIMQRCSGIWYLFFFSPAYSCLVQITSISQKPLSFLHKGNWPHPKRYWPLTPIFCNSQLNAVNCSELCRFSSWWLFIIPYSGRSPEITTFLGLVCDSFWICTVTVQQIKLEEELINISTLILIF